MKPVVEYIDYRQYLLDYYAEQKRCSGFTWRAFAKLAGFSSGSYLKLVCDGKTRLTVDGATKTATAMGLAGFELQYFLLMVDYNDSKDSSKKKKAFDAMIAFASSHNVRTMDGNAFAYFDSWKNPVLRELAVAMPNANFSEMAERCYPEITPLEVAETIAFLKDNNLLVQDKEGHYHCIDRAITTGNMQSVPEPVHSMQLQMSELAIDALKKLPVAERNFSGVTMGITAKAYEKILAEMAKFRRRVLAIATEDEETEQVYRLNLQLFPLTKPLTSKNENSSTDEMK